MQTFSIPYYKDHVTLNVPDENLKAAIYPKAESYQAALPEAELVREALEHPIGSEKLCELAKGKKKITIVTSDHTRPVPSKITLPILLAELRKGNPEAEITILIATGLHRETTQAEQRQMFGDKIVDEERIVVNNAFRKEDFDFVCKLPSDAELWVNREALTCDLLITEGFIEPHFFAGFSGGRKSILPGICNAATVNENHSYKAVSNPHAAAGVLEGNPIHEDMLCAAKAVHGAVHSERRARRAEEDHRGLGRRSGEGARRGREIRQEPGAVPGRRGRHCRYLQRRVSARPEPLPEPEGCGDGGGLLPRGRRDHHVLLLRRRYGRVEL